MKSKIMKFGILQGVLYLIGMYSYLFTDVSGYVSIFTQSILPILLMSAIGYSVRRTSESFPLGKVFKLFVGILLVAQIIRFSAGVILSLSMSDKAKQELTLTRLIDKSDETLFSNVINKYDYEPFAIDSELELSSCFCNIFLEPIVLFFLALLPAFIVQKKEKRLTT